MRLQVRAWQEHQGAVIATSSSLLTKASKEAEVCDKPPQLQLLEYQPGVEVYVEWCNNLQAAAGGVVTSSDSSF